MAERQGVIYAATDTTVHAFGEALSDDDGATWTPGLRFAEIDAIAGCLAVACQDDCQMRGPAAVARGHVRRRAAARSAVAGRRRHTGAGRRRAAAPAPRR